MNISATKSLLQDRLASKSKHLEKITTSLRAEHSKSFSEQAMERESDEVKEQLKASIEIEINQINAALDRIESDTYTACSKCDGPIGQNRLAALPYTQLCINCAD
ncbi:TraR/DksA C4-type zinc finger protein [Sneathiella marina]|uniref:TraR/DksA C4-type zinc finger protein n=1 Tax=Sneathiella marina TaxID=2950108 RepID=A0ABY4W2L0_9PROT|nr:TraR/DksA C4-type zinc finger protein [Sneathiella marina]USG61425.1 TraR/DksA C4-type zinc finger protein [Sneathiella marina]